MSSQTQVRNRNNSVIGILTEDSQGNIIATSMVGGCGIVAQYFKNVNNTYNHKTGRNEIGGDFTRTDLLEYCNSIGY